MDQAAFILGSLHFFHLLDCFPLVLQLDLGLEPFLVFEEILRGVRLPAVNHVIVVDLVLQVLLVHVD
jgi:hypothetical protein